MDLSKAATDLEEMSTHLIEIREYLSYTEAGELDNHLSTASQEIDTAAQKIHTLADK